MSLSALSIKTVCISLVLMLFIVTPGCTATPPKSEETMPVTSIPTATASPSPAPTSDSAQSADNVQLSGNVYGMSTDPLRGIDQITFSVSLPTQASAIDLTGMEIVFSATGSAPVTLTQGMRSSTGIFTATRGGNYVTMLHPGDLVEISFPVKTVAGGTTVTIELRPQGKAAVPITRAVPAMISSTNILE
jgi:archaellin